MNSKYNKTSNKGRKKKLRRRRDYEELRAKMQKKTKNLDEKGEDKRRGT